MSLPKFAWEDRPIEVAHLLNPAFGAVLVRESVSVYEKAARTAMPYPLAFLVLPLALYPNLREALPRTTASILHSWLEEHTDLRAEITPRVRWLVPYVREAVLFGLQSGMLRINQDAGLENAKRRLKDPFESGSDPDRCRASARFLASWFAKTPDVPFLFSLWGVRL